MPENDMSPDSHHVMVVPMSDGYAVSCSCGWVGGNHNSPEPAEQEAADHEARPDVIATQSRSLTITERFAWNLRRIRAKRKLSQIDLGARADLHRTEVSLLERAKREPRMETLIKLAAVLEVSLDELLRGIEWQPSSAQASPPKGDFLISPVEGASGDETRH
jgi:ribosome-binding protein aMBF1 (putative translation factor)